MISTNQFRTGMTIRYESDTYRIVDFQHVKPGKGGAFVRTKLKNVTTGRVVERTFRPEQKFDQVRTESRAYDLSLRRARPSRVHGRAVIRAVRAPEERAGRQARSDDGEHGGRVAVHGRTAVRRRTARLRGPRGDRDGARGAWRHGQRRQQDGHGRDRGVLQVPLFIETGDVIRIDTRTREYNTRI